MPIDPKKLLALQIPDIDHRFTEKDTILYALGIGLGQDPMDVRQLAFVYEKELKAFPTFANSLGYSPFWLRNLDTGIDFNKVVHGEHSLTLHRPVPVRGHVIGKGRILDVIDKGPGRGALVLSERRIVEAQSGAEIATVLQTTFCRGDGGFGGAKREQDAPHPIPAREPDAACVLATRPETALIHRLSGDLNPLHAEPAYARAAGFERPILHGLASFGIAAHAILKTMCDYDPARLRSIAGRFSAPVVPGESIRVEMWRDGRVVSFRASSVESGALAMSNGRAELRE
ncbi:MAG: MaoC/PaaZ C-terminal domain-containing protein [Pseudorhodoplanes sp.]